MLPYTQRGIIIYIMSWEFIRYGKFPLSNNVPVLMVDAIKYILLLDNPNWHTQYNIVYRTQKQFIYTNSNTFNRLSVNEMPTWYSSAFAEFRTIIVERQLTSTVSNCGTIFCLFSVTITQRNERIMQLDTSDVQKLIIVTLALSLLEAKLGNVTLFLPFRHRCNRTYATYLCK